MCCQISFRQERPGHVRPINGDGPATNEESLLREGVVAHGHFLVTPRQHPNAVALRQADRICEAPGVCGAVLRAAY